MPTAVLNLAPEKSYVELRNKVKTHLAKALKTGVLSIEELRAILFIFEKTETHAELEAFLEIFSESFPVLQEFEIGKRREAKTDLESKVKNLVYKIVLKNPLKAGEIAKATLKSGMTWAELIRMYPELEE